MSSYYSSKDFLLIVADAFEKLKAERDQAEELLANCKKTDPNGKEKDTKDLVNY